MRVALVCPYSLNLPGGVQGQVLSLARALRAMGHQARVLGPCDGPPPEVGVTPLGNSVTLFANGSVAAIAPDLPCVLRTFRALRDEGFDVVHLHEPLVPGPAMTTLVLGTVPMVGTFHTAGHSAAYAWLRPLTTWMATNLAIRCAVSADARDTAAHALGGEYVVLHNGIDVERYAKATPSPVDGPTILFVSRHESRKGLDVLLDAMAFLPSDIRLWIASDGPETRRLQARAAGDERIEWLGRITEDEKARRLRAADVLCAPSLHGESFGIVLLEGMAAQTAIVASDLPGYRNVARHGEEALLVPPSDAPALGAALRRVIEEPSLAASLVAAGDQRAAEFSMDRLAERYLELYQAATRSRPGGAR
ncbi:MAG: glycosyltransferase family 4 protein [Actinomycetota bacterium]|nr:glycosyltransferase family 4 protein [Actinomycetota bacterium]